MTALDRKLHLMDALGGTRRLSLRQVLGFLSQRLTWLFITLSLTIIFATDAPQYRSTMDWWLAALIWPISLGIYLSILLTSLWVFASAMKWLPNLTVVMPLVSFVGLVFNVYICTLIAIAISDGAHAVPTVIAFVYYYITVQVFELLFFRFVLPGLVERNSQERVTGEGSTLVPGAEPAEAQDTQLLVAGERFSLIDVLYIEARKHHVRLVMADQTVEKRARLSDILAQLEPCDGIQPHRSWWVSQRATPKLERIEDKQYLRLVDGVTVPVARGRVPDVIEWLEAAIAAQ